MRGDGSGTWRKSETVLTNRSVTGRDRSHGSLRTWFSRTCSTGPGGTRRWPWQGGGCSSKARNRMAGGEKRRVGEATGDGESSVESKQGGRPAAGQTAAAWRGAWRWSFRRSRARQQQHKGSKQRQRRRLGAGDAGRRPRSTRDAGEWAPRPLLVRKQSSGGVLARLHAGGGAGEETGAEGRLSSWWWWSTPAGALAGKRGAREEAEGNGTRARRGLWSPAAT